MINPSSHPILHVGRVRTYSLATNGTSVKARTGMVTPTWTRERYAVRSEIGIVTSVGSIVNQRGLLFDEIQFCCRQAQNVKRSDKKAFGLNLGWRPIPGTTNVGVGPSSLSRKRQCLVFQSAQVPGIKRLCTDSSKD